SVTVPTPSARLQYTVDSELETSPPRGLREGGPRAATAAQARYLQLPPLADRIPALARKVTAGSRSSYEAALKLNHYLSSQFKYTLVIKQQSELEPLEEFLFVRRSGNCEYFAASLAVMLRSLGIPARVVAGFQRGEWNPYGRYFMVRLKDAHSWVEAYFDGAGWVSLDPSPRAELESAQFGPNLFVLHLDALRMRWYRQARRALRRRGFRRGAGETAREFRQRVAAEAPAFAEPLHRLTAVYEGCRFGGRALGPDEGALVEAALAELRRRR